ncbi:hypothetical protein E2C01_082843 [Portunus trituberculatus]|uniref:Uncharacterized protein n=1 Tax=Portunus trituberculatus TaxID=210409 RepID=A0A5B7J058_PORTR|nr:hypothetical protein [Portunus trituberculatus]
MSTFLIIVTSTSSSSSSSSRKQHPQDDRLSSVEAEHSRSFDEQLPFTSACPCDSWLESSATAPGSPVSPRQRCERDTGAVGNGQQLGGVLPPLSSG